MVNLVYFFNQKHTHKTTTTQYPNNNTHTPETETYWAYQLVQNPFTTCYHVNLVRKKVS